MLNLPIINFHHWFRQSNKSFSAIDSEPEYKLSTVQKYRWEVLYVVSVVVWFLHSDDHENQFDDSWKNDGWGQ